MASKQPKHSAEWKSELINIADMFTAEGLRALKRGQVLIFSDNGVERHFKVKKATIKEVLVQEVKLLRPEDVKIQEKSSN